MAIKTKQVANRRQVQFQTYQDVLEDVRGMAAGKYRTLGNWSFGEICEHLAKTMDMSIDGSNAKFPWVLRMIGPYFKRRFITRPMPAGFNIPQSAAAALVPDRSETAAGVAKLETAIGRMNQIAKREPHAMFGPMTRDEWDQLHMRHCELHLSFVVPE
ncbi:MAG: DUF1569 domain-containing protein [Pirellulales bacterium]